MWEDVQSTERGRGLVHLRASFEGERVLRLSPTVSNHVTLGKCSLLRVWFLICVVNQRRCRISPRAGVWGERGLPGFLGARWWVDDIRGALGSQLVLSLPGLQSGGEARYRLASSVQWRCPAFLLSVLFVSFHLYKDLALLSILWKPLELGRLS